MCVLTDFVTPALKSSCLTSLMNQFYVGQSTRKCCRRFTNRKQNKLPAYSVTIISLRVEKGLFATILLWESLKLQKNTPHTVY